MLQKEFFRVQPFNPNPYWDPVIVNLSGAQKFEEDTIFLPGKYKVEIQAGASKAGGTSTAESFSGKIITTVSIYDKFIIRAYCGSKASNNNVAGVNPYSGIYKVNSSISYQAVPAVNHIFGNAGSCCRVRAGTTEYCPSSGNCLGNGVTSQLSSGACSTGAGSCLHFLPVGGTFGTDYLAAFHTTAAASGIGGPGGIEGYFYEFGGSGSAYGGAGSGCSNDYTLPSNSYAGGTTPYGSGGPGVSGGSYSKTNPGKNGSGIGHGFGGGVFAKGCYNPGAAAYFDGSQWIESTLVAGAREEGKIIVTYMGPLD